MAVIGLVQIVFGTVVPRTFNYYTVYLLGLVLGNNYFQSTFLFLKSKKACLISLCWIILIVVVFLTKNPYLKSFSSVVGIVGILNLSLMVAKKFGTINFFSEVVSKLSYASFCAYLFHREIISVMFRVYKPEGFWPIFLEVLIIGVPLSFFLAYYIQKVYDAALRKLNL